MRAEPALTIERDDLTRAAVLALIAEHLSDMHATSPAESVHALDLDGLRAPHMTFWTGWHGDELLGCAALGELDATHGEVKSMRTTRAARGRGVGAAMLAHVVAAARARGYTRVSLETGVEDYFAPARRMYVRAGFEPCPPFGSYAPDPNSAFFTLAL